MAKGKTIIKILDNLVLPKLIKTSPARLQNELAGEIKKSFGEFGYDKKLIKQLSELAFLDLPIRRPFLYRLLQDDQDLVKAMELVREGESPVKMAQDYRGLLYTTPESALTATYDSLRRNPGKSSFVYGTGLVSTAPILGLHGPTSSMLYSSQGKFGDMASITDTLLGGLQYGYRDWDTLLDYLNRAKLNNAQKEYANQLIFKIKDFEEAIGFKPGLVTTSGVIKKPSARVIKKFFGNEEKYEEALSQYLEDLEELSHFLAGNMEYGTKNQLVIFPAPYIDSIVFAESSSPNFSGKNIKRGAKADDIHIVGSNNAIIPFLLKDKVVSTLTWKSILDIEKRLAKINSDPKLLGLYLKIIGQPTEMSKFVFPLHPRSIGPNPMPMTTLGVSWALPTFKRGKKLIRRKNHELNFQ